MILNEDGMEALLGTGALASLSNYFKSTDDTRCDNLLSLESLEMVIVPHQHSGKSLSGPHCFLTHYLETSSRKRRTRGDGDVTHTSKFFAHPHLLTHLASEHKRTKHDVAIDVVPPQGTSHDYLFSF